jgi:hypothetical protein
MAKAKRVARLPWIDCRLFEDLSESYLARTVAPQVGVAMEAHYFGCDKCSDMLLTLRALQVALQERREAIRQEPWAARSALPAGLRSAVSRAYSTVGRIRRRR